MPGRPKFVPAGAGRPARRKTTAGRGYGGEHQRQRKRVLAERPVCERCDAAFSHHLHHKDRDPFNRAQANLEALCVACHDAEHGR
jgi:5-methylcytosine-specific restriction endonuclease McrA